MRYLRPLLPVVVAVGLGPLIAGLIFSALSTVMVIVDRSSGYTLSDMRVLFFVYIAFAYLDGAPIALLAGVLMSLWMIRHPPGLFSAVGSALLSVAIFTIASTMQVVSALHVNMVRTDLVLAIVMSVATAAICWFLLRPFAKWAG